MFSCFFLKTIFLKRSIGITVIEIKIVTISSFGNSPYDLNRSPP